MIKAEPLTAVRSIVVISDRIERPAEDEGSSEGFAYSDRPIFEDPWLLGTSPGQSVTGGYLERLPLACIASGLMDQAEIWHHRLQASGSFQRGGPRLAYRGLPLQDEAAPFDNRDMLAFVQAFGAPHILVVYGLGVVSDLLAACANSIILYNSIDAPTWRVPEAVSRHFDLVLTGAPWQSDEVSVRHPGMATAVLPVGPEFAAIDLFRPLGSEKDYDLVYVAAAQPYKRHDILFDALERLPRDIRALCVFGYGEDADRLRTDARNRGLAIDFVGPPGVGFEEVNRLMNRARFGVACGRDDGAPAILTEYMLAGLPVLANAELACGRQYILPETGILATAEGFADGIVRMRGDRHRFRPREAVLERWTWPHSMAKLAPLIAAAQRRKKPAT